MSANAWCSVRVGTFLLMLPILVAGCGDTSTVVSPPEDSASLSVHSQAAVAVACTSTWQDPVNGLWTDATKWTGGVVPGIGDDVCITVDGTYKVSVRGTQAAKTVTVGQAGNTGVQTLAIQGVGTGSILTAAAGLTNDGVVQLEWASGTNGTASTIAVTDGILMNAGTLRVLADGIGAPRVITADLVNTGLVSIEHPTTFNKPVGVYENQGSFTINSGRSVTVQGGLGQTFRQAGGTLTVTGSLNVTQETFEFDGGTITGRPTITNGHLRIASGSTGTGDFSMRGASTLEGDIAPAQTVRIHGIGTGSTLTSAAGFTNAGVIELQWASGNNGTGSTLAVTAGTLSNTGTLRVLADGLGAPRKIAADLLNTGTVSIQHGTVFDRPNGLYENQGSFTINSGRFVRIQGSADQVFRQAGGTLTATGSMTLTGQTFEVSSGTIGGRPVIADGTLRFLDGSTGTGDFSVRGASALVGDVPSGYTVRVNTSGATSATLTSATGFTNAGIIELQPTGGNNGTTANLTVTTGTLTNSGTVRMMDDAFGGSGRTISADLVNTGTIDLRTRTTFSKLNGVYVNDNLLSLTPGRTLTISGQGQTFTTTGQVTGGTLAFTAIDLRASGSIAAAMVLTNVDTHIGTSGPATLNVTGSYRMVTGGTMNIELSEPTPGTGHDRVNITGAATLLGTLNVSVVGGACLDGGESYEFMTFGSRSGDFTTKTGLDLGGGRTLQPQVTATNYRLSVLGNPCVIPDDTPPVVEPDVAGTLGNDGWYVSDVTVSWTASDPESDIVSTTGCSDSHVLSDTDGITFTCSATSAGGTTSTNVTIRRDATAPIVQATRTPEPNEYGWNNTDVTVTYSATDAMSGVVGSATATELFSAEGASQSGSHTFADVAGNTATATITGINIDRTPPTATCSATPAQLWPPNGRMVPVTTSLDATDALSGVAGFALHAASSSQPNTGPGPDIQDFVLGAADTEGSLRAARAARLGARVYTLVYHVVDHAGNRGECTAAVTVPHDQRGSSLDGGTGAA